MNDQKKKKKICDKTHLVTGIKNSTMVLKSHRTHKMLQIIKFVLKKIKQTQAFSKANSHLYSFTVYKPLKEKL